MGANNKIKVSQEKVSALLTILVENESNEPQDFFLFGEGRGRPNFGNSPAIKITCPNPLVKYDAVLANIQSNAVKYEWILISGLVITSIFSDKKRKFIFRRKITKGWSSSIEQIGKMVTRPIGVEGKVKRIDVDDATELIPDGWKLQPKEKILLDIETEITAPVVEAMVAPTAFIKINIENTSDKPLKYYLFNANLNYERWTTGHFGNNPAIKITWDSKLLHHSARSKEIKSEKDCQQIEIPVYPYFITSWDDTPTPKPRCQNYSDLLEEIRNGRQLNIINIYSPKRDYFLIKSITPQGDVLHSTKLALPYPLKYNDKSIVTIYGNTTLEPCYLELEPHEKTFIELEVAQWS